MTDFALREAERRHAAERTEGSLGALLSAMVRAGDPRLGLGGRVLGRVELAAHCGNTVALAALGLWLPAPEGVSAWPSGERWIDRFQRWGSRTAFRAVAAAAECAAPAWFAWHGYGEGGLCPCPMAIADRSLHRNVFHAEALAVAGMLQELRREARCASEFPCAACASGSRVRSSVPCPPLPQGRMLEWITWCWWDASRADAAAVTITGGRPGGPGTGGAVTMEPWCPGGPGTGGALAAAVREARMRQINQRQSFLTSRDLAILGTAVRAGATIPPNAMLDDPVQAAPLAQLAADLREHQRAADAELWRAIGATVAEWALAPFTRSASAAGHGGA